MNDYTKVSVVCTVKNEAENIGGLIESLLNQSVRPDEIIFVDGGSNDNTVEIIKQFQAKSQLIVLIEEKGANIAKGRNTGTRLARNEIVAITDAGSTPKDDWLENLLKVMTPNVDVVSGFYVPDARSKFESLVGRLTLPRADKIDEKNFLPSSRSVCFRKKCWEGVGGYSENSKTAEDTLFDLELLAKNYKFKFAKDAIVMWRCRRNFGELYKQWYGYAKGDGLLGLVMNRKYGRRHYTKILIEGYGTLLLLLLGAVIHPVFLVLLPSYLWSYYFNRRQGLDIFKENKSLYSLFIGPIVIGVIHLAQFIGIHSGFFGRLRRNMRLPQHRRLD
jgi:glycosyltransferase involved in cell wall biosynthesis